MQRLGGSGRDDRSESAGMSRADEVDRADRQNGQHGGGSRSLDTEPEITKRSHGRDRRRDDVAREEQHGPDDGDSLVDRPGRRIDAGKIPLRSQFACYDETLQTPREESDGPI